VLSIFIVFILTLHILGVKGDIANIQSPFWLHTFVNLIGYVFGLAGLKLCWRAQQEMGQSWRVGIDRQIKTELITTGVFRKIRNPTYSGLFMICLGALLILHTTLMLVWVVMFYISIEFQVRLEEEYLIDIYENQYMDYYQKTKRYIPSVY
jgi:protein-S-isoprenylcysteine O-methyltransferase Ste14